MDKKYWQKNVLSGITLLLLILLVTPTFAAHLPITTVDHPTNCVSQLQKGEFEAQWEKNYGTLSWWSARYEGPQPIGDADNDGLNELLIGGRDPFMRVLKWNDRQETYREQAKIVDPVWGLGYRFWFRIGNNGYEIDQPFGSATGFAIGDITNDGENEIGVAWGRHFSAFKWTGIRYKKIGMYEIAPRTDHGWDTTLDCIIGDCDNDGENEVVVTGGYSNPDVPEVLVINWDGSSFALESTWEPPGSRNSIYFPWIADVDEDQENELLVGPGNTLVVLDWMDSAFIPTTLYTYDRWTRVFGCAAKDSDSDGKPEIHVTFGSPDFEIWEWNGQGYHQIFNQTWEEETSTIEAVDIGDVDHDGHPEICVGTDDIHIFQWTGTDYQEEYVITDTFGCLAVTAVGDCDNDGRDEINAGAVWVTSEGDLYMAWVFDFQE